MNANHEKGRAPPICFGCSHHGLAICKKFNCWQRHLADVDKITLMNLQCRILFFNYARLSKNSFLKEIPSVAAESFDIQLYNAQKGNLEFILKNHKGGYQIYLKSIGR
jgi:hypothetical protein